MTAHAKLSASSSHRWLNCPGSVKAEEGLPNTSSKFADEGTAAHELADMSLQSGADAIAFIGKQLPESKWVPDAEMAEFVQVYVDYVRSKGGTLLSEMRVDFSDWVPEGFGTSDAIVISGKTLHISDLKYGKGIRVEAGENTQMLLYALGSLSEFGFINSAETISMSVVQPRLDHISEWSISIDELMKWGERIKQGAEEALSPDAKRIPGDKQCLWCKAKPTCRALQDMTHNIIATDFDNMDSLHNPDTLGDDELRAAMDARKLIVAWLDAVNELVTQRLESGESFSGYKLVEGRSNRQWSNEAEAEAELVKVLGDKAYERSLLSVAKAEKVLGKSGKQTLAPLVSKPQGRPTLAPESDPRKPFGTTANDFEEVVDAT